MDDLNNKAAAELPDGEYATYPDGYEKLLKDLHFPTEDEAMKRMLWQMAVGFLLRD